MAAATVTDSASLPDGKEPPRKKLKISELPLSSVKRASIDAMLHIFKKKGEFDQLRKKTYAQFAQGDSLTALLNSIQTLIDEELERDPVKYLSKDRRLAAPLLEGAAARANIYAKAESDIAAFISEHLTEAEATLRAIRRKEIGDDAAEQEMVRAAKSEEAYAEEARIRRVERANSHNERKQAKLKEEREESERKEIELLKKREQERKDAAERLAASQQRRAEREVAKEEERRCEADRLKQLDQDPHKSEEEKARKRNEDEATEAKRLEEEAMQILLRESQSLAGRSVPKSDRDLTQHKRPIESRHTAGSNLSRLSAHHRRARSPYGYDYDRPHSARSPRRDAVYRERSPVRDRKRSDAPPYRDDSSPRDYRRHRSRSPEDRRRRHRDLSRSPDQRRHHRSRSVSRRSRRRSEYRDYGATSPPSKRPARSPSPLNTGWYATEKRRNREYDNGRDDDRERMRYDDRHGDERRRPRESEDRPKRDGPLDRSRDRERRASRTEPSRQHSR